MNRSLVSIALNTSPFPPILRTGRAQTFFSILEKFTSTKKYPMEYNFFEKEIKNFHYSFRLELVEIR